MAEQAGSNEAVGTFAFVIISCILLVMYIPLIMGIFSESWNWITGSARPSRRITLVHDLLDDLLLIPRCFYIIARYMGGVRYAISYLLATPVVLYQVVIARTLRFILRPRLMLLWIWFSLLSVAMYAQLTYDPYAVLGLEPSASLTAVKKTSRKLMRTYHPDVSTDPNARDKFMAISKAYRALVDPETFSRDAGQNVKVGIALPSFLLGGDHDGMILFFSFSLLLALPLGFWFFIRRQNPVLQNISKVGGLYLHYELLLTQIGFPLPLQRKHLLQSRILHLHVLEDVTYLHTCRAPPLPMLREIIKKKDLGEDPMRKQILCAIEELLEANPGVIEIPEGPSEFTPVSEGIYRALSFILVQIHREIEVCLLEVEGIMASQIHGATGELKVVQRIFDAQTKFRTIIADVYNGKAKPEDTIECMDELDTNFMHFVSLVNEARRFQGTMVGDTCSSSDVPVRWLERRAYLIVIIDVRSPTRPKVSISPPSKITLISTGIIDDVTREFTTELVLRCPPPPKLMIKMAENAIMLMWIKNEPGYWNQLTVDDPNSLSFLSEHQKAKQRGDMEQIPGYLAEPEKLL